MQLVWLSCHVAFELGHPCDKPLFDSLIPSTMPVSICKTPYIISQFVFCHHHLVIYPVYFTTFWLTSLQWSFFFHTVFQSFLVSASCYYYTVKWRFHTSFWLQRPIHRRPHLLFRGNTSSLPYYPFLWSELLFHEQGFWPHKHAFWECQPFQIKISYQRRTYWRRCHK